MIKAFLLESNAKSITWSVNSSDLNPIEDVLCKFKKKRVHEEAVSIKENLLNVNKESWKSM